MSDQRGPGYDIDAEPSATAADWLEVAPGDRHPYGFERRTGPRLLPQDLVLDPEPEAEL